MYELNWELYAPYDGEERSLCVVFDIDGTLARHDHRGPYDYLRVDTDGVFENIKNILDFYWEAHYSVFLVSGRPEADKKGNDIRGLTEKWLKDKGIRYDHLFMRPAGDFRKDDDIKHEVFDREFRDEYDIENWFDDRNRVVERMRKLGINVLQVASGDF